MNTCVDCGKQIFKGHGQKRCEECQKQYQQQYQKQYRENNPSYNKAYYKKANAPNHILYQYAKFLKTLTLNELQALYSKNQQDLSYLKAGSFEWKTKKSQLKAITTEYSSRDEELERIKAYEEDGEYADN